MRDIYLFVATMTAVGGDLFLNAMTVVGVTDSICIDFFIYICINLFVTSTLTYMIHPH